MIINISESIAGAREGQPAILGDETRVSKVAGEAIKPGRLVCRKDSDVNCKLPTTAAEVLAGIGVTVLSDTIPLTTGAYAAGLFIPIYAESRGVWVVTIDAATQGGQVFVNYAGANPKGSFSAAFVAGENVAVPGMRFGSTQATPGGLAYIIFDLPSGGSQRESFGSGKGFVDVVVDLASVTAATAPAISTTVAGSLVGDTFEVSALTDLTSGLVICAGARCRVAGTVVWRVGNVTVGNIDPASNTFRFNLIGRELA